MSGTIKVLVGCQNSDCATEVSYHLDMVRMLDGEPICQDCYEEVEGVYGIRDEDGAPTQRWGDLPPVKLEDLRA